jgi:hypothetical protein
VTLGRAGGHRGVQARGAVLHPEAVRPDDPHAAAARRRDDPLLQLGALRPRLREAARQHDDRARARDDRIVDDRRHRGGRDGGDGEVDAARHVAQPRVGAQAADDLAARTDRDDLPGERLEVAHDGRAELARLVGGADDGDAGGIGDRSQIVTHAQQGQETW